MRGWVRAVEPGEVQDAHIHGGERHVTLRVTQPLNRHGNINRPTRIGHLRCIDRNSQLTRAGVDLGIGQPQGPRRIATSAFIHRADHLSGHVSARAPFFRHGHGDQVVPCGNLNRLHVHDAVRHHGDQRGPRIARHNAQLRRVTGAIIRTVERQVQCVGRAGGIAGRVPSCVEFRR